MHESEVAQINENDELLCCTDEAAIMCTKPTKRAACQLEAEQDHCSLQLLAESKKCESFCATNVCAHGLVSLAQLHTKLTAHACCLCAAVVCWQENVRMAAGSAVLEHRPSHREKASAIAAGGGMLEHRTPLATLAVAKAHLPIKGDSLYGLGPTQFALRFGLPPPASLPGYIKPPGKRKRDGLFYGPLAWKPPRSP